VDFDGPHPKYEGLA